MIDGVSPTDAGLRVACRDLIEMLTDYLEGALSPATAAQVRAHLRICPACQLYLDQVAETVKWLGRTKAVDSLNVDTRADILRVFRELLPAR